MYELFSSFASHVISSLLVISSPHVISSLHVIPSEVEKSPSRRGKKFPPQENNIVGTLFPSSPPSPRSLSLPAPTGNLVFDLPTVIPDLIGHLIP